MELNVDKALSHLAPSLRAGRRAIYIGLFFVLVWPAFNLLFVSTIWLQLGVFDDALLASVALRMVTGFAAAYLLIQLLQWIFPVALAEDRFWPQWLLHVLAILFIAQFSVPFRPEQLSEVPQPSVLPLMHISFQITLYVAVKTLLLHRDRYLAAQLNLRQAQVNTLRSQSNPHFLFNTLNLLASEIGRDPDNARDIVYDLADLLRDSMRAAEREFTTLEEELRLVELYLTLQKKRFPERLDFEIEVDDRCRSLMVPALLLQPVVENVIKHVVAHSTAATKISLCAELGDEQLAISVRDNGPQVDAASMRPGGGLRIVDETLALHYRGKASLSLESTHAGGHVRLLLPLSSPDH